VNFLRHLLQPHAYSREVTLRPVDLRIWEALGGTFLVYAPPGHGLKH